MPEKVAQVISTSSSVSFQDSGRFGFRKLGIPPAGALDQTSAQQANELLDNLPSDPVIEIGVGGLTLEIHQDTWLALAGYACCSELAPGTARLFRKGETITIKGSPRGLWSYLTAPGGWLIDQILGSASYHSRSELGSPIYQNDWLTCTDIRHYPHIGDRRHLEIPPNRSHFTLHPAPVPHSHAFSEDYRRLLCQLPYKISPESDRSGYRLTGTLIPSSGSIRSLPVLPGSLQVPPSGEPIVTLQDGPTVGGYPLIAIIDPDQLSAFVQRPPFSEITFSFA